jgi:hypothetical protein
MKWFWAYELVFCLVLKLHRNKAREHVFISEFGPLGCARPASLGFYDMLQHEKYQLV